MEGKEEVLIIKILFGCAENASIFGTFKGLVRMMGVGRKEEILIIKICSGSRTFLLGCAENAMFFDTFGEWGKDRGSGKRFL